MAVFYSFNYGQDVNRVQLVRNMGAVEGQTVLSAQEWEQVKRRGNRAIQSWIDEQMSRKSAVIVLVGSETASRPWVQYEIQRAWDIKKPMLGIYIHGLSSMGATAKKGADPFTQIDSCGGRNPGFEIYDPTVFDAYGRIDSSATYNKLRKNLLSWSSSGRVRQ